MAGWIGMLRALKSVDLFERRMRRVTSVDEARLSLVQMGLSGCRRLLYYSVRHFKVEVCGAATIDGVLNAQQLAGYNTES